MSPLPSDDLTLSIMPNRKAVVSLEEQPPVQGFYRSHEPNAPFQSQILVPVTGHCIQRIEHRGFVVMRTWIIR